MNLYKLYEIKFVKFLIESCSWPGIDFRSPFQNKTSLKKFADQKIFVYIVTFACPYQCRDADANALKWLSLTLNLLLTVQLTFTCSQSTIETKEKGVKYSQS